ncbi:protein draper-like [Musca vetustissima]|uniref:protein draper-like n=1 Tax=Musca vetustissima TaxID=27455 RepID=UPI002AB5E5B6|nr:protein draper-like [Musca vetustissima]
MVSHHHQSLAQWCTDKKYVSKTRIQWNNGERLTTKLGWLGNIKYKYEPYVYSSMQYYTDYETVYVCCRGYKKIDSQCVPDCRPSCPTNSHCAGPDRCECSSGYVSFTSQPFCTKGYEMVNGKCVAVCVPSCPPNAKCVQPNQCSCSEGYTNVGSDLEVDNATLKCQAKCLPQCPENSYCERPNECVCKDGYSMNSEGKCEAVCSPACLENAFCKKPNQCECLEGYELGKVEEGVLECVPQCEDGCPENGFCSKPNQCECSQGYNLTANGRCEPVCDPPCPENSKCEEGNVCSCLRGYEMVDHHCEPVCEKPCPENSHCSEPNMCQCFNGYQPKNTSIYEFFCEPLCQPNCSAFARCAQPNKCECLEGYAMDEVEQCKPQCTGGCLNGLCYRPEVCICKAGYLMGPNQNCEPTCSMACQNGTCVEPEICQCSEGYRFQGGSVNICEPVCEPECHNGVCVEPNICICHENYEPLEIGEGAYNHSYCQKAMTTTSTATTINDKDHMITWASFTPGESSTTTLPLTTPKVSESTPIPLLENCVAHCQCWQEYDEFGTFHTNPQCVHLCMDPYDKPCLNLSLCHCDEVRTQLLCHIDEEDLEEEPQLYMCKIPRILPLGSTTTTTISTITSGTTPDGHSNEMQIIGDHQDPTAGQMLWIILASVIGICGLVAVVFVVYRKYCNHEDPLVEYEL